MFAVFAGSFEVQLLEDNSLVDLLSEREGS